MGVVASVTSTFSFPLFAGKCYSIKALGAVQLNSFLLQGGHVGLVWGWFIPCPFVLCVAACLAEMTSAMPCVTSYIHHLDN